MVEFVGDGIEIGWGVVTHVGGAGKVLADKTTGPPPGRDDVCLILVTLTALTRSAGEIPI